MEYLVTVTTQLDFRYSGLLFDPVTGQQRKAQPLIFTASSSRHMFVWLSGPGRTPVSGSIRALAG